MNRRSREEFEKWAEPLSYKLTKNSCRPTENPYTESTTYTAYEGYCAGRDKSAATVEDMNDCLNSIVNWELPETGEFWDKEQTKPLSYSAAYGSNGERDYIRNLAAKSLVSL